jgi:hypothetical protein
MSMFIYTHINWSDVLSGLVMSFNPPATMIIKSGYNMHDYWTFLRENNSLIKLVAGLTCSVIY